MRRENRYLFFVVKFKLVMVTLKFYTSKHFYKVFLQRIKFGAIKKSNNKLFSKGQLLTYMNSETAVQIRGQLSYFFFLNYLYSACFMKSQDLLGSFFFSLFFFASGMRTHLFLYCREENTKN